MAFATSPRFLPHKSQIAVARSEETPSASSFSRNPEYEEKLANKRNLKRLRMVLTKINEKHQINRREILDWMNISNRIIELCNSTNSPYPQQLKTALEKCSEQLKTIKEDGKKVMEMKNKVISLQYRARCSYNDMYPNKD